MQKKILRLLDANLNRAKEALRVIEDIARFILDDKSLTYRIKDIRHGITEAAKSSGIYKKNASIAARSVKTDVGKTDIISEVKRNDYSDIFFANFQRAKESTRCLEEFFKLYDIKAAKFLKKLRYKLYAVEKIAAKKISH
ncbi:MAG: thiamine-phosphate pyrophosphorylase [Candidatus Omnitrophota bacterium]